MGLEDEGRGSWHLRKKATKTKSVPFIEATNITSKGEGGSSYHGKGVVRDEERFEIGMYERVTSWEVVNTLLSRKNDAFVAKRCDTVDEKRWVQWE